MAVKSGQLFDNAGNFIPIFVQILLILQYQYKQNKN